MRIEDHRTTEPSGQAYFTAASAKRDPDDDRAPAQRRHDALAEAFRLALGVANLPATGGEQPHIGVLVHARDLQRCPPGHRQRLRTSLRLPDDDELTAAPQGIRTPDPTRADTGILDADPLLGQEPTPTGQGLTDRVHPEPAAAVLASGGRRPRVPGPGTGGLTEYGGILHPEAVRRLACDAGIHRVVFDRNDVPINAGRRVRLPGAATRRVLVARDGGCRFPGCHRPPACTEAHHVVHWADGGPTDLDNLVLLCGFHHHRVHDDGWTLRFDGRELTVRRPDGTTLDPP